jgi:hypothetical protein
MPTLPRLAPGDPEMSALARFCPSLASHSSLDCGVVRVGRDRFLVFYGGAIQDSHPFESRASAVLHLLHLDRMNAPNAAARREAEAAEAAARG